MKIFRRFIFVLFIAALVFPSMALAHAISGEYECTGASADGSGQYSGQVSIEKDSYDSFKFHWEIGGDSYSGIGILNGDVVSVAYKAEGAENYGIVVYKIVDGGNTLEGKWIFYPGGQQLANETLKRKALASTDQIASFDCAKAFTPTEKIICSNTQLSNLDNVLMQSYKIALVNTKDSNSLKIQQRDWLANIRNQCNDSACLIKVYNDRISELNHMNHK